MPSLRLHQDKDAELPLSKPLASMQELKDWDVSKASDVANIASVTLRPRKMDEFVGPKLLLCHDMAGGYKEDQWIQGNNYDTIYNIKYWQYVDSFIYFSHNRVTIPPVNWINTCHRNGVACLGTFIVEGDQMGELEMLLHGPTDHPILGDDDPMRLWNPYFADKLVAIAKHYGFDGWLMNVECSFVPFPTPVQIKAQQLTCFLDYFRNKLHEEIPGSSLIWYDSLTVDGKVDWQNQLDEKNLPFFKVTDGIFLNYWWKDNYPKEAFDLATTIERLGTDVYFGTDVWGRGTHGGGRFQSYKGVEDSSKGGTSSALFGNAWTYEYFSKQNFDLMDRLFWKGGKPSEFPALKDEDTENLADAQQDQHQLDYHPGVGQNIRPFPSASWFSSCFDRGYGTKFYAQGQALLEEPWSHLSHQNCPPNLSEFATVDGNDAYNGGSSLILRVNPPPLNHTNESTPYNPITSTMIYSLSIDIKPCSKFRLSYAYKPMPDATNYTYDLNCILRERLIINGGAEIHKSHCLGANGKIQHDDDHIDDGILITDTTTQTMKNGWILQTVDFGFTDGKAVVASVGSIDQLGFMVSQLSSNGQEKVSYQDKIDLVRIGMVSVVPLADDDEKNDGMMDGTHRFNWQNVMWERVVGHDDGDQATLRFWGTLDWNWMNNRKGEELQQVQLVQQNEQQKYIPEWRQTEYTLVYLTSAMVSGNDDGDNDDTFLGTSFSSLFRISGADMVTGSGMRRMVKIKMVDALGRLQSSHTIDLPSISYYR